ncbi:methyltransferase domain-containing protein [Nocardiopsis sp. NPDC049922]|uniref:protein-L-isoaspartate O-methyltransferase family protein n=1 Tax=Nocardiopsis sp. NPDC049922 TaxID=3155157 RepID=UPI0033ED9C1E
MAYSANVASALAAVDEDFYTLRPDGRLVTQSTVADLIARMLDQLDVRPGMRVLEIGTGSGFSGALLSELVGPTGSVVSMDVVADLSERARELHKAQGRVNVELITGDGAGGAPDHGPFDRIVAWATPEAVPEAWVAQSVPGAVIVTPVEVTPRVKSSVVLRAHVDAQGRLHGEELTQGRYVEMHDEVLDQWLVPPRGVDALVRSDGGPEWWIAAEWAKEDPEAATDALRTLSVLEPVRHRVLVEGESAGDFTAYLYATRADELSVVGMGAAGSGFGFADATGIAVLAPGVGGDVVHVGASGAVDRVRGWVDAWREAECPGHESLCPVLRRVEGGWRVRAALVGA